ncbi:hypothetical protein [Moritella viscosa]|uniref:Uncharacterized protein n=1 Tax=Moritella viscosa TaxID=80854 RepID=A0ABY1HGQ4_9GAMM|nr:hypothetical protein [Moritella viscosa]CED60369.1 putative uncharacterized protein [Moritella viscosa]SGY97982.1 Putative uncharacterized protein [Moritella viscosa]SGZ04698.1 Putative uncharacterized protein [Moritella viscosa]SGZ11801.1 Putative uncharacterized protein [Moritella viscosa]SHO13654.1 Putative uncharacterized protein [Moritella viscosa]
MSHYTVLGLSTWFELVERIGSEAEAKTYFSETKLVEYNNRTCLELVEAGMLMHLKNWLAVQYQEFKSTGERLRREQVSQSTNSISSKLYSIEVIRTRPQVGGQQVQQAQQQRQHVASSQFATNQVRPVHATATPAAIKPEVAKPVVAAAPVVPPKPRVITSKAPAPEKKPAAASMANFFMRQVRATKSELEDRKHHN